MDLGYFMFYIGKRLFHEAFLRYGSGRLSGRILDIGSGTSPYQDYLDDARVFTLENSVCHGPDVVGSALQLPIASASLDGVICTEVLEHLPEPGRCLSEIRRVLKPGGTVYLTTPMTWYLHYQPHDYYRFTPHGLEYLLREAGLEPEQTFKIGGFSTVFFCIGLEKAFNLFAKLLFFLPKAARPWTVVPVLFPVSWLLFHLSRFLDSFGRRWIFSVGALAVPSEVVPDGKN